MHLFLLGSGLSEFSSFFPLRKKEILYDDVLNSNIPSVEGHPRKFILTSVGQQDVLLACGKYHFYEGLPKKEIEAILAYALKEFKIERVWVTSASGGLSNKVATGNWYQVNRILSIPTIAGYSSVSKSTTNNDTQLMEATYAFQQGPSLGTTAEYKMLSNLSADLIGMSLLPELDYLTNQSIPFQILSTPVVQYHPFQNIEEPSHQEVIQMANKACRSLYDYYLTYLNRPA